VYYRKDSYIKCDLRRITQHKVKAGTDQARRSAPCRAKRSRTLQARSVWTGYRAQTRNNAHEQAFANIIRLMSVHQRNFVVRARSIWTDFLCLSVNSSRANANTCLDISNLVKMEHSQTSAHLVSLDSSSNIHEFC
jgi:hypothetical protein